MSKILLLNGPNLNLLGTREPSHYGHNSLEDIVNDLTQTSIQHGHQLSHLQSNAEFELINRIHQQDADVIIINPAAFTHTSIAIRDAFLGTAIPFIEVHLSNVHAREAFRQHSYLSDIALGVISGFGKQSYQFALLAAFSHLSKE